MQDLVNFLAEIKRVSLNTNTLEVVRFNHKVGSYTFSIMAHPNKKEGDISLEFELNQGYITIPLDFDKITLPIKVALEEVKERFLSWEKWDKSIDCLIVKHPADANKLVQKVSDNLYFWNNLQGVHEYHPMSADKVIIEVCPNLLFNARFDEINKEWCIVESITGLIVDRGKSKKLAVKAANERNSTKQSNEYVSEILQNRKGFLSPQYKLLVPDVEQRRNLFFEPQSKSLGAKIVSFFKKPLPTQPRNYMAWLILNKK